MNDFKPQQSKVDGQWYPVATNKYPAVLGCHEDWTFGTESGEVLALAIGWRARLDDPGTWQSPSAKDLGLYPNSQNLRISWERGWLGADAVCKALGPTG